MIIFTDVKGFLFLILSVLPQWLLYRVSYGVYFIVYYLIKYRKKVVRMNLENAFPSLSNKERKSIEKSYFKYLPDLLLESFFMKRWRTNHVEQYIQFLPSAKHLLESLYADGKSIMMLCGHYGNWEWSAACVGATTPFQQLIIYKPIKDKAFEYWVNGNRTKFDSKVVEMNKAYKAMMNEKSVYSLAVNADQSPRGEDVYWTQFLNQETCFFLAPYKMARKLDLAVVYISTKRTDRGQYSIDLKVLAENATESAAEELAEAYVRALEKDIQEAPQYWLWSHRRWKRKRK